MREQSHSECESERVYAAERNLTLEVVLVVSHPVTAFLGTVCDLSPAASAEHRFTESEIVI